MLKIIRVVEAILVLVAIGNFFTGRIDAAIYNLLFAIYLSISTKE